MAARKQRPITERECLHYYDQLREAHRFISVLDTDGLPEELANGINAVDSVLYLAEGLFVEFPHRYPKSVTRRERGERNGK